MSDHSHIEPTVRGRSPLATLSGAHFLNDGAANYLPGVLPAILLVMDAPVALAGLLMGALMIGQGLQPFTGWLADRIGGRRQIALGLLGTSVLGMAIGLAPNLWTLTLCLVSLGIANAFFHPPALSATRRLAAQRPGRAMSYFLVGGEIGRGAWPLLASAVVASFGLGWLWLLGVPGVIMAYLLPGRTPVMPVQRATQEPVRWRTHLRPMRRIVALSALRSLMILAPVTFLPILWHQRGASLNEGAATITTILVVGVIGNLGGGFVSDRYGRGRVLVGSLAAAVIFLTAILLASGLWVWPLLACFGIAVFATLPLTVLIAQDQLPANQAMGSGLALGFANALSAVGVMLLGPIAAYAGVHAALALAVIGGVVALVLALKYWK